MYERLLGHPNVSVQRKARQMLFGFLVSERGRGRERERKWGGRGNKLGEWNSLTYEKSSAVVLRAVLPIFLCVHGMGMVLHTIEVCDW